jgi:DNA-directed RNA polymerase specialized sigma24 family protein
LSAISKLPAEQRDVTRLIYLEEVSPLQVALQLNISDEELQRLLMEAERNLKKYLPDLCK